MELLNHTVFCILRKLQYILLHSDCTNLLSHLQWIIVSFPSTFSPKLIISCFLFFVKAALANCEVLYHVVLLSISVMISDINIISCSCFSVSFGENFSNKSLRLYFSGSVFWYRAAWVFNTVWIFKSNYDLQIFSTYSVNCLFILLTMVLYFVDDFPFLCRSF